jgi:glucose dehydrogenase
MATLSWGWWLSGVAYWGLAAAALVAAVLRMKKKGVSAAGVAVVVLVVAMVVGTVVAARGKVMEGMKKVVKQVERKKVVKQVNPRNKEKKVVKPPFPYTRWNQLGLLGPWKPASYQ